MLSEGVEETTVETKRMEEVHGYMMLAAWSLVLDISILSIGYLRGKRLPFNYALFHGLTMTFVILTSVCAALFMVEKNQHYPNMGL